MIIHGGGAAAAAPSHHPSFKFNILLPLSNVHCSMFAFVASAISIAACCWSVLLSASSMVHGSWPFSHMALLTIMVPVIKVAILSSISNHESLSRDDPSQIVDHQSISTTCNAAGIRLSFSTGTARLQFMYRSNSQSFVNACFCFCFKYTGIIYRSTGTVHRHCHQNQVDTF
jgi:magnesium-transporting ATPase (P-type)